MFWIFKKNYTYAYYISTPENQRQRKALNRSQLWEVDGGAGRHLTYRETKIIVISALSSDNM